MNAFCLILAHLKLRYQLRFGSEWQLVATRCKGKTTDRQDYLHSLIADRSGDKQAQQVINYKIRSEIRKAQRRAGKGAEANSDAVVVGPLHQRTTDGATVIHKLVLHKRYSVALELIKEDPALAKLEYTSDRYRGENILHMSIAARAQSFIFELLDLLWPRSIDSAQQHSEWLSLYDTILDAEVTGDFFKPGEGAYYGGQPLLFAVATNQKEVVRKICAKQSRRILDTDRYGNNVLHLAVLHGLREMYDFVLGLVHEEEDKIALSADHMPLELSSNREGLSPMALAAAVGRFEMFRSALMKRTVSQWAWGPVNCKSTLLYGLDAPVEMLDDVGQTQGFCDKTVLACLCAREHNLTEFLDQRFTKPDLAVTIASAFASFFGGIATDGKTRKMTSKRRSASVYMKMCV